MIEVEITGLNQGKDGACTLVSVIHADTTSGVSSKMFSRDISYVLRYWRSYWKPETTDSTHGDNVSDIAAHIDSPFELDSSRTRLSELRSDT